MGGAASAVTSSNILSAPTGSRNTAIAGMLSMILRAFLLLGKFGFVVALAKWTSPETLGIYALIVTIVTISIYLIGLELHTFTAREIVSGNSHGERSLHIQSHLFVVFCTYALVLPLTLISLIWLEIFQYVHFLLFGLVLLFEILCQELGRYLLILSRPIASNALQFIRGAAWMPFAVFLLLQDIAQPIDIVLTCWVAGGVVAGLFGLWHIREFLFPLVRFRLSWLKEASLSARHYFVVALLTQVQIYSDRFIIQRVMGEAQVGILSFYQSFAGTMVAFVQTGVISVMLPRLMAAAASRDHAAEKVIRFQMFKWAVLLAIAICAGLALFMPLLLDQLGKSAYSAALPIFYVLLFGNLILVVSLVVHLSLYARRQDAQLMRTSLIIVPIGLAANIYTAPIFGLPGVVGIFCLVTLLDLMAKCWLLYGGSSRLRRKTRS
jgi:O-antigen/teichoic acid export membrane protein